MNLYGLILLFAIALPQQEEDLFKKGLYLFEHQDFRQSINIFNRIINNNMAKDENELAECYKYLGAAYFYLEDMKSAEANFRQYLFLRPESKLDPFIFPPSMVLFFDRIKKDIVKNKPPSISKPVEKDDYSLYINFLPFGAPQFAHHQKTKGSIVLILQTLSLGLNISSYWKVRSMIDRYGFVKDREAADEANLYKTIQITSLISFAVIYIYSVSDGLYYTLK